MQRACYRCGTSIDEQITFCPACGAPQIRVSRPPEELSESGATATMEPGADPPLSVAGTPANLTARLRIDWKSFSRTAAPLAAFTGMVTVALAPLGLFVVLPVSVILAIYIYCRHRPVPVRGGLGARMGAVTGLFSFFFFTVFFLVAVYLNSSKYREIIVDKIHEIAAQNPDPQAQQMLQWFTTPHGIATFTVMFLLTVLVFILMISAGIGALAVAYGKPGNRRRE